MENNTKILIGAGALAVAYYMYNVKKATEAVSTSIKTPVSPVATTPVSPVATTPVSPVFTTPVSPVATPPTIPERPNSSGWNIETEIAKAKAREAIAAKIAADEAAAVAAQIEIDRLAEQQYRDEEAARNKANELAYQTYLAEAAAQAAANKAAEDKVLSAMKKQQEIDAAADAAREKAMRDFMYPTCPDGFEWFRSNCTPSYIVVEQKATDGEGLILRDMYRGEVSLVQSCPAEYVKQGINCIPRYSLSPQQLQVLAMEDAGMVQTSDGQWYLDAKSAAAAQALIDAQSTQYSSRAYSARQSNVNDAICSVTVNGVINNPYSSVTNGMSLREYIGQYRVTAAELNIARASCPNSVYSSGRIAGGGTDDNALGYKDYQSYQSPIVNDKKTAVEPDTKPCEVTYHDCTRNPRRETIQIPIYADCYDYQQAKPPCAPQNNEPPFGYNPFDDGSIAMKQNPNYGGGGFY